METRYMESLPLYTAELIHGQDKPEWLPPEDSSPTFTKDEMAIWTWLVSKGIANALAGLSQMVGHEIRVSSLDLKQLSTKDAAALLGGPESLSVGIYLTIHGDASGHLLLLHDPKMAFQLIDLQLGLPPGATQKLEEMERSVLGEMGNITGTFFLNAMADTTNLVLMPSPPAVIVDMLRTILNVPLAFIMEKQDDAFVVKTTFRADSRQIEGTFIVLPTMDFMKTILKHSRTPVPV